MVGRKMNALGVGVLLETSIEDGVGDLVTDLVRVTLTAMKQKRKRQSD